MAPKRVNFISKEQFESKIIRLPNKSSWNDLSGTIFRLEDMDEDVVILVNNEGVLIHSKLPEVVLQQMPEGKQDSIIYVRPTENDVDIAIIPKIFCEKCQKEFSSQRTLNNHNNKTCNTL